VFHEHLSVAKMLVPYFPSNVAKAGLAYCQRNEASSDLNRRLSGARDPDEVAIEDGAASADQGKIPRPGHKTPLINVNISAQSDSLDTSGHTHELLRRLKTLEETIVLIQNVQGTAKRPEDATQQQPGSWVDDLGRHLPIPTPDDSYAPGPPLIFTSGPDGRTVVPVHDRSVDIRELRS
jgi:hypothetical protein